MIRALVFDLDDTLYVESDFVASGYRAVARHLQKQYGHRFWDLYLAMMNTFACRGRDMVFPVLLERFPGCATHLEGLVAIYRNHAPEIRLLPGYEALLRGLRQGYRLGIVTDGHPEVQRKKVEALGLGALVDRVIYTWDHGADKEKPHPLGFVMALQGLGTRPTDTLFVGDNPAKDCRGARRAGMKCVRVNSRRTAAWPTLLEDEGDAVIESLHQLPHVLEAMR